MNLMKNVSDNTGRRGQATIEYVLMLASIVVVLSAFLTAFHNKIVFFFFHFIGQLLTN